MEMNVLLPEARIAAMRDSGLWSDRLLLDYLAQHVRDRPDQLAVVDRNAMTGQSTSLSYRQLDRLRACESIDLSTGEPAVTH